MDEEEFKKDLIALFKVGARGSVLSYDQFFDIKRYEIDDSGIRCMSQELVDGDIDWKINITGEKSLSRYQEIMLDLIESISFNRYYGETIVKFLKDNYSIWTSVIPGGITGLILRDLPENVFHADSIFIMPSEGNYDECKKIILANKGLLHYDEFHDSKDYGINYIELWWD